MSNPDPTASRTFSGGSANTGPQVAGTAGGGSAPRVRRGGSLLRGSRPFKEYYVYDPEFRELKNTGAIATVLFAVGSACVGFSANVLSGLGLAENLAANIKAEWVLYRNVAITAAGLCYLVAVILSLNGYNRIEQIKAETSHGGERYVAKPWYKWGLTVVVYAVIFAAGVLVGTWWVPYLIRSS